MKSTNSLTTVSPYGEEVDKQDSSLSHQSNLIVPFLLNPPKTSNLFKDKMIRKQRFNVKLSSNRKSFIRKKLVALSLSLPREIYLSYKHVIFGFIDIEDSYRDFDDPFDQNLIRLSSIVLSIHSVIRDFRKKELIFTLNQNGPRTITDFTSITNHFRKLAGILNDSNRLEITSSDFGEEYRSLWLSLSLYQEIVNNQQNHLKQLKHKIESTQELTVEECARTQKEFVSYIEDKFKEMNLSEDDCYSYGICATDFNRFDIQPIYQGISNSLLNVYGVPLENAESIYMHSLKDFGDQSGRQRLKQTVQILERIIKDQDYFDYEVDVHTLDNIPLTLMKREYIIYWQKRPSWASKLDYICVLNVFDVSAENIKRLIKIRAINSCQQNSLLQSNSYQTLEQMVQAELFIDKFYASRKGEGEQLKKSINGQC